MTQDEIIAMAREAGGEFYVTSGNQTPTWYFSRSTIYDFAKLVAAKALVQRTWVWLTDVEIDYLLGSTVGENEETHISFARAIEAKLKDKNS